MTTRIRIGLYHKAGTGADISNRLRTEGIRAEDIAVRRLRDVAPMRANMAGEARGYASDPLFGNFILKRFGDPIPNGETAVCVDVSSKDEVRATVDLMRQYVPVGIEILSAGEIESFLAAERKKPPPR
jgi:hypothetical protein